jgi:Phosphotransferase enzyme family
VEGTPFAWRTEPAQACWDAVGAWVREVAERRGIVPAGEPVQFHAAPWSTVARVPTGAGPLWFKANGPGSAYEPALLDALGRWQPAWVVPPVAVDPGRAWSLSPDGGRTLRAHLGAGSGTPGSGPRAPGSGSGGSGAWAARWADLLGEYGRLQRSLADRVDDMLALGVPDLRPARLPARLDELLADPAVRTGVSADQHERLSRLRPRYADWCAELAAGAVPASVQHDDLHDANVFVSDRGYRFFDWGDASVAHPFGSLLVALRVAAYRFDLPPGDPALHRLREAYLEPWDGAGGHTRAELVRLSELAVRVTKVSRALAWRKALLGVPADLVGDYADSVPGWLAELLEPDLLGS